MAKPQPVRFQMNSAEMGSLRCDGRAPNERRAVSISYGVGSGEVCVEFSTGLTKVLARTSGVAECSYSTRAATQFKLDLAWTGDKRCERSSEKVKDMERTLSGVFDDVALIEDRRAVETNVMIIQDGGSLLSTVINAASLAMCLAGVPMKDVIVSLSSACTDSSIFIDPCSGEENETYGNLVIAFLPTRNSIVYLEMVGRTREARFVEWVDATVAAARCVYDSFVDFLRKAGSQRSKGLS